MPEFEPMLIICAVLVGVMIINGVLVLAISHPDTRNQFTIFREAFRGLRYPWAVEDQTLDELRGSVAELDQSDHGGELPDAKE